MDQVFKCSVFCFDLLIGCTFFKFYPYGISFKLMEKKIFFLKSMKLK